MKSDELARYKEECDRCKKLHAQYLAFGESHKCLSDPLGKLLKKVASVLSGKRKDHRCNLYGEMLEYKSEKLNYRINPYAFAQSELLCTEIFNEFKRRTPVSEFAGLTTYQKDLKAIDLWCEDAEIQAGYCLDASDLIPIGSCSDFDEWLTSMPIGEFI